MPHTTYYFKTSDGSVVLNGDVEPTWVTSDEVFTMSHPRHVRRILAENPDLDVAEIVALTEHFDEIEGIQVAPFTCGCEGCEEEAAEQQRGEIEAEMAIEHYYEGGWDKTGEYSRELYENGL